MYVHIHTCIHECVVYVWDCPLAWFEAHQISVPEVVFLNAGGCAFQSPGTVQRRSPDLRLHFMVNIKKSCDSNAGGRIQRWRISMPEFGIGEVLGMLRAGSGQPGARRRPGQRLAGPLLAGWRSATPSQLAGWAARWPARGPVLAGWLAGSLLASHGRPGAGP